MTTPQEPILRIEMLGGFAALCRGEPVVGLTPLASALLAYLALKLPRSATREELLAQFWPDDDPDAARHRLRQQLHHVRRALSEAGCDPDRLLVADRTSVGLCASAVSTDVHDFEAALVAARAGLDPEARLTGLTSAVALYRGDLLPGVYYDELAAASERLAAEHLQLLHDLADSSEETGDLDGAVAAARRIVGADPLVEQAHIALMRLLAAKGQPVLAVRQYHELQRILGEELGEKPSAAAQAMFYALGEIVARPLPARQPGSMPLLGGPGPSASSYAASRRTAISYVALCLAAAAIALALRSKPGLPEGVPQTAKPITGQELWVTQIKNRPDEKPGGEPTAVTTDKAGNIYLTGFVQTWKHDVDYLTVKLDRDGNQIWRQRYNGPGNDVDRARLIAVDGVGNVYVTGDSAGKSGNGSTRLSDLDVATVKYGPDGQPSPTWPDVGFGPGVRRYDGPDHGEDRPVAMMLDDAGNLYVLAKCWQRSEKLPGGGFECALIKYTSTGRQDWVAPYKSGHGRDEPVGMARDREGAIYVALTSRAEPPSGPETGIMTVKFDPSGHKVWEQPYGAANGADDEAWGISVDASDLIYVAGLMLGKPGTPDAGKLTAGVVSYDSSGGCRWARNSLNPADRIEKLAGVCAAADGTVVLAGRSTKANGDQVFRVVMKDQVGMPHWAIDYHQLNLYSVALNSPAMDDVHTACGRFYDPHGRGTCIATLRFDDGVVCRDRIFHAAIMNPPIALTVDSVYDPIVACQTAEKPGQPALITVMKYAE